MANTKYMSWLKPHLAEFMNSFKKDGKFPDVLFIPFAGVTISFDRYYEKVREAIPEYNITSIHNEVDMAEAVRNAKTIMVGGGNTFHLLYKLYEHNLVDLIRERVLSGVPYVGWSAGSNIAGPDIGSTNDMPIIFPPTDKSLNLIPYNLNPHYNEWAPPNFQGETRSDRLNECALIKNRPIVAFSEGLAIQVKDSKHTILAPELPADFLKVQKDERMVKVWNHLNNSTEITRLELDTEIMSELKRMK